MTFEADAEDPIALRKLWTKWGDAIVTANRADACPINTDVAEAGPSYSAIVSQEAHFQLAELVKLWSDDAKLFLCGSVVTQGHLTQHSDIDFVCLPASGEVQPERSKQLAGVEGLHRHVSRFVPTYMRRQFVSLKTARTPVVKFGFTHEVSSRVGLAATISTAVLTSRFHPPTPDEEELSRSVLVHLRGMEVTKERVEAVIAAAGLSNRVLCAGVEFPVRDAFQHPLGFSAVSTTIEDSSVTSQAEAALLGEKSTSTLIRLRGVRAMDAVLALGLFPDGILVAKSKRDLVTTDLADRRYMPHIFRCQWDVSFAGYSVANSYLLRHYLGGSESPLWVQHGALALKRWARCSHVANAQVGMLTPYAVTIMWVYFLLVTRRLRWVDPESLPAAGSLPLRPPVKQKTVLTDLSEDDLLELGRTLAWFFRYFAGPHEEIDDRGPGFQRDLEVVSLNRPHRSCRKDLMGWEVHPSSGAKPGYLMCVEDPFELRGPNEFGLNLGRHLTPTKLEFIQNKFFATLRTLLMYAPSDDLANKTLLGTQVDPEPNAEDE